MRSPRGTLLAALVCASSLLHGAAASAQTPAESAAAAGFDDETGIWFPPDAPRQTYLDRSDPQHQLIPDVRKAFQADPALARAVAALLADPRRVTSGSRLSDSARQLKTMFEDRKSVV